MNKILLGIGIGIGAVCMYNKMKREGYISGDCEDAAHNFFARTRKGVRNVMDAGKNEAEYLKEQAEYGMDKGKEKLDDMMQ